MAREDAMRLLFAVLAMALASRLGAAESGEVTRFYEFNITMANITRLCQTKSIVTVNGQYPGPEIHVNEGDTLVVKVTNQIAANITIHWHGVFQNRTGWFDGPNYITQCPIQSGNSYTYKFTISNQRGTLWWHAHVSWMRATVHGALLIRPKVGVDYPHHIPHAEKLIILGEWWKSDVQAVLNQALASGGGPNISDAFTINSQPGPFYNCSTKEAYELEVEAGKTYLLRIISAAMNTDLFFSIANHSLTVVEADASYLKPFSTDVIVITPGQTTNVLFTANRPIGEYYMAARAYFAVAATVPFDNTTTAGVVKYKGASMNATSLPLFPLKVDRHLFFTVGLNLENCPKGAPNSTCQGNGGRFAASVNNVTFVLPKRSILQAHYMRRTRKVFQTSSAFPPFKFDFTGTPLKNLNSKNGTKALTLRYGQNVQIILQGTSLVNAESHPIHLHGYDFFVVGQGFGNFKSSLESTFNLVDPPSRNTIGVPPRGWTAIRFTADNPGAWFMHCHLDIHTSWGLDTVLRVLNGKGPLQSLEPPPKDYPAC